MDYAKGDTSGFVRFDQPEEAQKLRAAAVMTPEGGLTIGYHLVTFEALEGGCLLPAFVYSSYAEALRTVLMVLFDHYWQKLNRFFTSLVKWS